jgi:hypothetical protein
MKTNMIAGIVFELTKGFRMIWLKALFGLMIILLPLAIFLFATSKKRMPKAKDMKDYQGWSFREGP